jgi:acetyl esterase/lipase
MHTRRDLLLRGAAPLAALAASAGCGMPLEHLYSVQRGLRYGPEPEHRVDLWQPRFRWRRAAPGVLLIHGGAWREGSPVDMEEAFCRFFLRHGMVVANIEYRKAPRTRAPEIIADARLAAQWLDANAARFRILRDQLVYCGTSAGGHLALMAGFAPEEAGFGPAPRPCAVFNLWGVSDLAALALNPLATALVRDFVPAVDVDAAMRRCSPLSYIRADLPPVMSIHTRHDELVPFSQSERLHQALRHAGDSSRLVALDRGSHQIVDWNTVHAHLNDFLNNALDSVD